MEVLAVVEMKRNPDDVGDAFLSYQSSLSWLAGLKHLYDPAIWKTKAYPKGHFNRPFLVNSPAPNPNPHTRRTRTHTQVEDEGAIEQEKNGSSVEKGGGGGDKGQGKSKSKSKGKGKEQEKEKERETLVFTSASFAAIASRRTEVKVPSHWDARWRMPNGTLSVSGIQKKVLSTDTDISVDRGVDIDTRSYSFFLDSLFFVCKDGHVDCITSKAMAWYVALSC